MRLLSRTIFRENFSNAALGVVLFTLVLFLPLAQGLFEYLVRSSGPTAEVAVFVRAGAAASPAVLHTSGRAGGNAADAEPHVGRRRDHGHAGGGSSGAEGRATDPDGGIRGHAGDRGGVAYG